MKRGSLIVVFFVFNCVTIVSIALPSPPAHPSGFALLLRLNASYIQPFIRPYAIGSGLMQYWNMFVHAAGERNDWFDIKYHLDYTFSDGSTARIDYPRVSEMSFTESLAGFRYRKFLDFAATNPHLFQPMTRSIALQKYPSQTPLTVNISQSWARIPAPADSGTLQYIDRPFKTLTFSPQTTVKSDTGETNR